MKSLRYLVAFAAIIMIAAIVLPLANTPATVHAQNVNPFLEGTWLVTVTENGRTPFPAMVTFNLGGTLVESAQPDRGGPGQGVWRRTGLRTFGFTFEQYQWDANGNFAGTLRVRERAELDQSFSSYSGIATVEFRTPDGTLERSCARTHATRMDVKEPDCR